MPVRHLRANAIAGAGALRSTTEDMMKFLMANLDVSGPPLLRKAMRLAQKGRFKAPKMIQALSWQRVTRQGVEFIDKNGGVGGFSSWMGMVPDQKNGLILLFKYALWETHHSGAHTSHYYFQRNCLKSLHFVSFLLYF